MKDQNRYLTPAGRRFLTLMRDGRDRYAIAEGLEVWVDHTRFSRATLNHLLRLCLLQAEGSFRNNRPEIYFLNTEARLILNDAAYVPAILRLRD